MNDAKLITSYLDGDKAALEILFQKYLKLVYGFIVRRVGNPEDADEITQDAFIKAWKNLKRYDQSKNFKAWILTIAKNTAIDFLRKRKMPLLLNDQFDQTDPAPLQDATLVRMHTRDLIRGSFNLLSPAARAVMTLYYEQELNFREIAAMLGEPLHTIKSRHRRAIIYLKNLLTAQI